MVTRHPWLSDVVRGARWLALGRLGTAVLLTGLALMSRDAFHSVPGLLWAAAGAAGLGGLGWIGRRERRVVAPLFLADIAWIALAVLSAGRVEAGLGLLFALVAFAAGLCLGGRLAQGISLISALALVATVDGIPDLRTGPHWVLVQGLLVFFLGAASGHVRKHLVRQDRALADASEALEQVLLDTDTIVRSLPSGILSVDASGSVVHINRAAVATLGMAGPVERGGPLGEALPPGAGPFGELMVRALRTGEVVVRGEIAIQRDGREVPVGIGTTVLRGPDDSVTGVVALFQDLSDIRRQEVADRRRDRLAAVGELAAGIAHEIRNSVLPISGSMELLGQELQLNPEQARLFEMVQREMDNIERFVGGLLRYSRTQTLHLKPVDLGRLLEELAGEAGLVAGNGVTFRVEGDPVSVRIDEEQLRQAIRNLVLNAADVSAAGNTVILRTGWDGDGAPWIEVEDEGPGIPPEQRARVLEPFYTSKAGGTGLGLAIVARIVEDHEGSLQILEGARGGARFRIVLNRMEAHRETAAHAA